MVLERSAIRHSHTPATQHNTYPHPPANTPEVVTPQSFSHRPCHAIIHSQVYCRILRKAYLLFRWTGNFCFLRDIPAEGRFYGTHTRITTCSEGLARTSVTRCTCPPNAHPARATVATSSPGRRFTLYIYLIIVCVHISSTKKDR